MRFAMEGGEVGDLGMWSEQFTELQVGDNVFAEVAVKDGEATAITAPMTGEGVPGSSLPGTDSRTDGVAAGYIWDGLHWPVGSLPAPYYVNSAGLPAGATSAITAAAQTWENDPGSCMDFTYLGATGASPDGGYDGVNVIGAGPLSSATTIAQCRYWYDTSTLEVLQFDITFNTANFTFATNGSLSDYDVQGIGTHELGHTLSLLDLYDEENSNQVMYGYGYKGDTGQRVLAWGDIAGIRAIYPSGAHPLAGQTIPYGVWDVAYSADAQKGIEFGSWGQAGVDLPFRNNLNETFGGNIRAAHTYSQPIDSLTFHYSQYFDPRDFFLEVKVDGVTKRILAYDGAWNGDITIDGLGGAHTVEFIWGTARNRAIPDCFWAYVTNVTAKSGGWDTRYSYDAHAIDVGSWGAPLEIPFRNVLNDTYSGHASVSRTFPNRVKKLTFHYSQYFDPRDFFVEVKADGVTKRVLNYDGAWNGDITVDGLDANKIEFIWGTVRNRAIPDCFWAYIYDVKANGFAAGITPVYRFRNLQNGFYLWSIDPAERTYINSQLAATWKEEGAAYGVNPATNTSTLWRFLNMQGGHYLYTADSAEKDNIVATLSPTWRYEGPAYSVSIGSSGSPVWRFRNLRDGTYLYSADASEKDTIVRTLQSTWHLEGVAYYLAP